MKGYGAVLGPVTLPALRPPVLPWRKCAECGAELKADERVLCGPCVSPMLEDDCE